MKAKQLAQILVAKGLVVASAVDRAMTRLPEGESFADLLVREGLVQETDLLRAIAQDTDVRFMSSVRLNELRVSHEALDRIPAAVAQKYLALPVAYDAARKTLTVAMADPALVAGLDEVPDVARLDHVVAVLALPSVLRAAVERVYGLGKSRPAEAIAPAGSCSHCGEPYELDQLECAQCGLLLNPDAPIERTGQSMVRALLASPTGMRRAPRSNVVSHDGPTRLGLAVQLTDTSVPEIAGGLEMMRSLAELEAFLVTWVDGETSLAALSESTGLMAVEVRSVVASLVERQVLRLLSGPASQQVTGPLQTVAPPAADPTPPDPVPTQAPEPVAEPLPSADLVAQPVITAEVMQQPAPVAPRPAAGPAGDPAAATIAPARIVERPAASARPPPPVLLPTSARVVPQPPAAKIEKRPESRVAQEAREARNRDLLARLKPQMKDPAPAAFAPVAAAPAAEEHKGFDPTLSKALAMEKRGDINGAIRMLREGIERASHPAPLYNRLAVLILNRQRDPKHAEELLYKAIALEPENPVYRQNLLKVLALLE